MDNKNIYYRYYLHAVTTPLRHVKFIHLTHRLQYSGGQARPVQLVGCQRLGRRAAGRIPLDAEFDQSSDVQGLGIHHGV